MYENERLERELTEKFGECLVTSSDIRFLKSNGYKFLFFCGVSAVVNQEEILYHLPYCNEKISKKRIC